MVIDTTRGIGYGRMGNISPILVLVGSWLSLLCAQAPYPLDTPTSGEGLAAYYWSLPPASFVTSGEPQHRADDGPDGADNTNAGWADGNVYNTSATGSFVATTFDYTGNDLTPVSEWLGADSDSLSGEDTNLGDAAFRMVGYLRVDEPGEWTFTTSSDDGSVVYVNDTLVLSNDNGHGSMTVTGTIDLPESGYYPIDVRYFNGDWTNDAGDHGGANFAGDEGFEDVVSRLEGVEPFYQPPLPVNRAVPLAHYSLDELAGETVLRDVSGRRRDGVFDGVELELPALATGTSAAFEGGAQAVDAGRELSARNLTVSLWLNASQLTGTQALVGKGARAPVYVLSLNDDKLAWFVEEEIDLETSSGLIIPNQIYHVSVTHREQAGQVETVLFLDSVEVARNSEGARLSLAPDTDVNIGAYNKNLSFNGQLDDLQFYDRALDADAIKGLFEEPGSVTNFMPMGELPQGAIAGGPEVAGAEGLAGYYWLLDPKEVPSGGRPMHRPDDGPAGVPGADAGWADENLFNMSNNGSFVATSFNYTGNDLTKVGAWLSSDRGSWTGEQGILGDVVFRMVGYLYVDVPGKRSFTTTSDDTSVLYISDERVISNNTNETVTSSVEFPAAGYYPVDIRFYNGDWTNDAGDHGGARYLGQAGFEDFVVSVDGVEPFYVPEGAEVPRRKDELEPLADPISGGQELGGAPGLAGYYWALEPRGVPTSGEPLHRVGDNGGERSGWADDNVFNTPNEGRFDAASLDYSGNDLTPVGEWLG